jgi:hypothetical protein
MLRRLDAVRFGPGEFFLQREATTITSPAMFGAGAPTGAELAGIGLGGILLLGERSGQRHSDNGKQVAGKHQP